jgi:hypothetical protein
LRTAGTVRWHQDAAADDGARVDEMFSPVGHYNSKLLRTCTIWMSTCCTLSIWHINIARLQATPRERPHMLRNLHSVGNLNPIRSIQ